jgi:hypothetical protein
MDMMVAVAFVAFFVMIVAWMAAPTAGKRPAPAAVEPSALSVGEARA